MVNVCFKAINRLSCYAKLVFPSVSNNMAILGKRCLIKLIKYIKVMNKLLFT